MTAGNYGIWYSLFFFFLSVMCVSENEKTSRLGGGGRDPG
jgi:hypothetical protein